MARLASVLSIYPPSGLDQEAQTMTHMRAKLVVAAVVLIGALAYLATAGVSKGWVYYLSVDQFAATPAKDQHRRVRLYGKVADEDLEVRPGQLMANFTITGNTGQLRVAFHGVVPDTFKAGCEAVVEGQLDSTGVFQADTLLTKCASKYQAKASDASGGASEGAASETGQHPAEIAR